MKKRGSLKLCLSAALLNKTKLITKSTHFLEYEQAILDKDPPQRAPQQLRPRRI